MKTEETKNTKLGGKFPSFPKRGVAPDFDTDKEILWCASKEGKPDELNYFQFLKITTLLS
jgi:hypothetical protein